MNLKSHSLNMELVLSMCLSTWFRDYLYIPIGGSKGSSLSRVKNVFIIFIVSGFWHGANWTFIVWGALNALYFLPLMMFNKNRKNLNIVSDGKLFPSIRDLFNMIVTFLLTVLAWIFFRSESVTDALLYIGKIFSKSLFSGPSIYPYNPQLPSSILILLICIFMAIEWLQKDKQHALELKKMNISKPLRWVGYSLLIFLIGMYMPTEESAFIYFQF